MYCLMMMVYCEGEVCDSDGNFVVKVFGMFKYMWWFVVGCDIKW